MRTDRWPVTWTAAWHQAGNTSKRSESTKALSFWPYRLLAGSVASSAVAERLTPPASTSR
jgi:hypothetical protein